MSQESVIDPVTGKPRLMSEMRATCVFREGNPMHLRPGRLKELIRSNTGPDAHGLVCHDTLSYGKHPKSGAAFCHGFWKSYRHLANFMRICERLGGYTLVDPPGKDSTMIRCICGYEASSENDLDQHVLASMHSDEDHAKAH